MTIDETNIRRFFAGKCSVAEAKYMYAYLKQHPEILDIYFDETEWIQMLQSGSEESVPYDEKQLLESINHSTCNKKSSVVKRMLTVTGIAASILAIGIFFVAHQQQGSTMPRLKMVVENKNMLPPDSVVWTNHSGHAEERRLSDGSVIRLYSGSELRYRQNFEKDKRFLSLIGRARFTVAKNPARPFTVVAGDISTTALGTIFYVCNKEVGSTVSVRLLRGKVRVQNIKRPLLTMCLVPGESCRFDGLSLGKQTNLVIRKQPQKLEPSVVSIKPKDESSYIHDGIIQFKNERLPTVFSAIGKYYHINIRYSDIPDTIINKNLYSGSFNKNKINPDEVLNIISLVNNLSVEKADTVSYRILSGH